VDAYKKIFEWDIASKNHTQGYDRMASSNLSAFPVEVKSKKRFRLNDDNQESDVDTRKKSKNKTAVMKMNLEEVNSIEAN
jgi:hypothetical protein